MNLVLISIECMIMARVVQGFSSERTATDKSLGQKVIRSPDLNANYFDTNFAGIALIPTSYLNKCKRVYRV